MKRLFLIAMIACIAATGYAQVEKGLRWGVHAGFNAGTITDLKGDMSLGAQLGVIADYNFSENFYLGSGLSFQNKGVKDAFEGLLEGTLAGTYLTLPIHVGYRFNLSEASYLHVQAGPQLACGLFGSEIEGFEGETADYFDEGWANRFELGVGAKVGVEFKKKWQVNLGFNYGVTEWADTDGNAHMLDVTLGAAYMF